MLIFTKKPVVFLLCVWCLVGWGVGETGESGGAAMDKTEQSALYSAIQGFVGNWWNGTSLYPDPCGWTPIQGVSCDVYNGTWYVTGLSFGPFHENSLACAESPEIRSQLFELKHLKSLYLFDCFTSPNQYLASVPDEKWLQLSRSLEKLEIRSNPGLIGEIPSGITSLTGLESLVILENQLTGHLPGDIARLTGLKRLVLSGNQFTGRVPDVGGLTNLLILDLSSNSLSGSLPLSVGRLSSLLKLDLSNNYLEGKIPRELGFLKNLTILDLRNNKFSGGLTREIQEMYSLEELALSNNRLGGDLMGIEWKKMGNLVILDLSKTGMTGKIPLTISKLKKLRFLGLSNNNLTGNLIPEVETTMPSLGALYVNGNNMTGELQFSRMFYQKMGRRFGAWGNPNLCYPVGEMSNNIYRIPFGVNPCKQKEITLIQTNSKNLISNHRVEDNNANVASLGSSRRVSLGFLWIIFVVKTLMTVVLFTN